MKKSIVTKKDLALIEKNLAVELSGVFSLQLRDEEIHQFATTFLYLDKNIYVFLQADDDIYEKIKFDYAGSFTFHKTEINSKKADLFSGHTYKISAININGKVREVDDVKFVDQLIEKYHSKYSQNLDVEEYLQERIGKPIMIDTEEMFASTEEGN